MQVHPCIRPVGLKFEWTDQDSSAFNLFSPHVKCTLAGNVLKFGNFSYWKCHSVFMIKRFIPNQSVKNEKYRKHLVFPSF